jgi:hypothetical protein
MRVKFYYTVRELTNHAAELFALRMLGAEVFAEQQCGYESGVDCVASTAWQNLHLGGNFSSAWTCPLSNGEYDAALRQNKLAGRWLNYYVEGLRQSVAEPPHIQGVYYDGILFGRVRLYCSPCSGGAGEPVGGWSHATHRMRRNMEVVSLTVLRVCVQHALNCTR